MRGGKEGARALGGLVRCGRQAGREDKDKVSGEQGYPICRMLGLKQGCSICSVTTS